MILRITKNKFVGMYQVRFVDLGGNFELMSLNRDNSVLFNKASESLLLGSPDKYTYGLIRYNNLESGIRLDYLHSYHIMGDDGKLFIDLEDYMDQEMMHEAEDYFDDEFGEKYG